MITNQEGPTKMVIESITCDGCKYLVKMPIVYGYRSVKSNYFCSHPTQIDNKFGREIDHRAEHAPEAPYWCPFINKQD